MPGRIAGYAAFFCFIALSSACFADTQRLCTEKDLKGSFVQVELNENPRAEETKWFADFHNQYLKFNDNHTYGFVASRHKVMAEEDLDKAINATSSEDTHIFQRKYTLDSTGLLNLYLEDKLEYSYRCMVVIKAVGSDQVGDLMFMGYSKYRTFLYKLFRRWP